MEQDLHLLGQCIDAGVAWWSPSINATVLPRMSAIGFAQNQSRLRFVDYADVHFISALHGTGVGHLYDSIHQALKAATAALNTHRLTRILEDAVAPSPMGGVSSRYAHAGGQNPIVVIHGSQTQALPASYARYLEKTFRRVLELHGTPILFNCGPGTIPTRVNATNSPSDRCSDDSA